MGVMPRNVKADTRLWKFITVQDFFFLLFYNFLLTYSCNVFVHSSLQLPYSIFSGLMSLLLVVPSRYNHKKRFYWSVFYFLTQSKCVYKAVRVEDADRQQEGRK